MAASSTWIRSSMSPSGTNVGKRRQRRVFLHHYIHQRIHAIERGLERVRGGRATQRQQRQAVPLATIALVGYTNAGKSSLFNRLTGAAVLADAKMFAMRAREKLAKNTPDWRRATDIVLASNPSKTDLKDLSQEGGGGAATARP